ncbi:MAG: ArsB/NhaD family transporter [Acidimicrobiia bacterium]
MPLLLASLASSVLPVSNLTNLIVQERTDLTALSLLAHLGPASAAATITGWRSYRRRHPTRLALDRAPHTPADRRALRIGGWTVAAVLIGFTAGPAIGIDPWVTALAADAVLLAVVRELPWRDVPLLTALGVAAVAVLVAIVVPDDALHEVIRVSSPGALVGVTGLAATGANLVNNLPAVLVGARAVDHTTWGMWAWLLGVNVGAVLLPVGALANLLWLRILRAEAVDVTVRGYVGAVAPFALPALAAATAAMVLTRVLT